MRNLSAHLHESLASLCPDINTVRSNDVDKNTWEIVFGNSATDDQKKAAQNFIDKFDLDAWNSGAFIIEGIEALEAQITSRRRDEAILGVDNGWLKNVREKILELRNQIK